MSVELELKAIKDDLISRIDSGAQNYQQLQAQVDALDKMMHQGDRFIGGGAHDGLKEFLSNHDQVKALISEKSGRCTFTLRGPELVQPFLTKTVITSAAVGAATTGVLGIDRMAGVTTEAREKLTVRGVLASSPTNMQLVDYVRVKTPLSKASPQVEASDKFENVVEFESKSEAVRTLATWIPASRQIMDDFSELANFLKTGLRYYTNLEEELQLLSGSGQGVNLNGLITQATAFNTALLPNSWNKVDIIGRAVEQITVAKELMPTFVILHPSDWWSMRLAKDSLGRYILGGAQSDVAPSLFGLSVVPTTSIAAGTFLVGSGSAEASEIRDRMEMQVEISTEHADYFVKNLVAVRCEKRLALVVRRPGSYVTGTFTTSP